uniref:Uncharacterized protein n=1 Tax=Rhizophora mucronata TaxID=61149 RepID=A0A2P2PJE9_RHIMU
MQMIWTSASQSRISKLLNHLHIVGQLKSI